MGSKQAAISERSSDKSCHPEKHRGGDDGSIDEFCRDAGSADELHWLVLTVEGCEGSSPESIEEGLHALQRLAGVRVSAGVLMQHDLGKRVRKLTKSNTARIATSAATVVKSWKEVLRREA